VANDAYTLHTGDLYICGPDGTTTSVGNVQVLAFNFRPNVVEHRKGKTGGLDALLPLTEDFELVVTVDEMNPFNWATALGVDVIETQGGCIVPFKRTECNRVYGIQFVHTFPCGDRTLTIDIWRALIVAEVSVEFGETPASFQLTIRATECESSHPDAPYGQMTFNVACPTS
jgi:hypothetical protein